MAIQNRRGEYKDFNPSKLVPGEMAFVLSGDTTTQLGSGVYACFAPNNVQRLSTKEEVDLTINGQIADRKEEVVAELSAPINTAIENANAATNTCISATSDVNAAISSAQSATSEANAAATAANNAASLITGLGTVYTSASSSNNESVSVTGSNIVATMSLPAGVWIVTGHVTLATIPQGGAAIQIRTGSSKNLAISRDSSSSLYYNVQKESAVAIQTTMIVNLSNTTQCNLLLYIGDTSGSTAGSTSTMIGHHLVAVKVSKNS